MNPSSRRPSGNRLLILLDYDGTLTPIRRYPGQARLSPRMRALLRALDRRPGTRVGIVSGRSIAALRRLAGLGKFLYVGNHGLEAEGPGLRYVHPGARRAVPRLRRIASELQAALRGMPGAVVEWKRLSLSVHWRAVPTAKRRAFHRRVREVLARWAGQVRVSDGRRIVEVRPPVDWDKGRAVAWLQRRLRVPGKSLLYAGDDRTDEDAFKRVNRAGGVTVHVGTFRNTAAAWRLDGPRDVERLLTIVRAQPWNRQT